MLARDMVLILIPRRVKKGIESNDQISKMIGLSDCSLIH
jgi:hypothetical protein